MQKQDKDAWKHVRRLPYFGTMAEKRTRTLPYICCHLAQEHYTTSAISHKNTTLQHYPTRTLPYIGCYFCCYFAADVGWYFCPSLLQLFWSRVVFLHVSIPVLFLYFLQTNPTSNQVMQELFLLAKCYKNEIKRLTLKVKLGFIVQRRWFQQSMYFRLHLSLFFMLSNPTFKMNLYIA